MRVFFIFTTMNYPIYRKLNGFKRYYKIVSDKQFIEAIAKGSDYTFQDIIANQYPEMLRIQDMINCEFNFIEMTEEEIASVFEIIA